MTVTADPRMMVLRTFPYQGWSCEFSLEKGGPRIRSSGARNASHEETQDAIWVSRASSLRLFKKISLKNPFLFSGMGMGMGGSPMGSTTGAVSSHCIDHCQMLTSTQFLSP